MSIELLLDEVPAPVVAAAFRDRGHDIVAGVEQDELRALTDEELFRWAAEHDRRIVTENVKDFSPLLRRAEEFGQTAAPLLFTSSRYFARPAATPGPLIDALDGRDSRALRTVGLTNGVVRQTVYRWFANRRTLLRPRRPRVLAR